MTGVLQTLSPQISQGTPSVISLQESEDGQEHLKLPSGTQIDLFGPEALHANLSQSLEKEKEKTTSDTSGLSSLISSESANLQQCLENKLQQLSDMDGSMIYKATLRQKVTPAGRVYSHLGLSGHRTKGTDSSLPPSAWPTPILSDMKDRGSWDDLAVQRRIRIGKQVPLSSLVQTTSPWPTPSTRDHKGGYKGGRIRNGKLSVDVLDVAAQLTAWPTPQAMDSARGPVRSLQNGQRVSKKGVKFGMTLVTAATLSPWATPNTLDHMKQRSDEALARAKQKAGCSNLKDQIPYSGEAQKSSTAETESTVPSQLNPRFSLWLMGYPIEWAYSGERVTPSSHKQQRKS